MTGEIYAGLPYDLNSDEGAGGDQNEPKINFYLTQNDKIIGIGESALDSIYRNISLYNVYKSDSNFPETLKLINIKNHEDLVESLDLIPTYIITGYSDTPTTLSSRYVININSGILFSEVERWNDNNDDPIIINDYNIPQINLDLELEVKRTKLVSDHGTNIVHASTNESPISASIISGLYLENCNETFIDKDYEWTWSKAITVYKNKSVEFTEYTDNTWPSGLTIFAETTEIPAKNENGEDTYGLENWFVSLNVSGEITEPCSGIISATISAFNTIGNDKILIAEPYTISTEYNFTVPDYSAVQGLAFESLDKDLKITLEGTGNPIAFNYKTANSIDSLNDKEDTEEIKYDSSINETISREKYTQFNSTEQNLNTLTVSTDKQFNLIGDLTKFIAVAAGSENNIKPFKGNTNLKKLINFKIIYADTLNKGGVTDWTFWSEQFSDCENLESVDISFNLPSFEYMETKLTNLFKGCSNLSYIRVKGSIDAFDGAFVSNDWLVADDLPDNGILIVPADVDGREDRSTPFTLEEIYYFNDQFLAASIVRRLLEKGWTIKSE